MLYSYQCQHHHQREEHKYHSKSKSSNLSRYLRILRLIFEESTHVTKSSIFLVIVSKCEFGHMKPPKLYLVTINAGSVITSMATRTWPCSMNFTAACTW